MDSFVEPDWDAEIDVEAHLAQIPRAATIKGMFIQDVVNLTKKHTDSPPGQKRYTAFKSYGMDEWVDVLVRCARICYPSETLPQALRRMGLLSFPMFQKSIVGSVIFSMAGGDPIAVLNLYPKALSLAQTLASAEVEILGPQRALVRMRDMWDFPESYNVGVVEGTGIVISQDAKVTIQRHSPCDADLLVDWQPAGAPGRSQQA